MLSPKTKRNIRRIVPFGIIWFIFSIVYTQLERGILGKLNYYPATGNPYNFTKNIFITPVSALITGLLIGILEIKYFFRIFLQMSFTRKIIYKSLIYFAIIMSFLIVTSIIANIDLAGNNTVNKSVWSSVWRFLSDFSFWSVTVYVAAIIVVTQFYSEVSENLGQEVLTNFFTGKYHKPKEEERIFMFLDMKSSTTIAENLGHVRYFELLKEYYYDLSDPIIKYSGEIYQYVGDEIIVSWTLHNGLTNNNCILCFFEIRTAIRNLSAKYVEKFGLQPAFKAGFHLGKVTTGEIGNIKKEIIFTGDVLNTTARIQGLCNSFNTDLIISNALMKRLTLSARFKINALGETELRGKEEKTGLYTIYLT